MNTRLLSFAGIVAAAAVLVVACQKPEPIVAVLFHQELCPGCGDYQRAEVVTNRLLELGRADHSVAAEAWQVVSGPSIARLKEIQSKYGLSDLGMFLPCLVVDGRVVEGYPAIEQEMSRLEAARSRSWWGRSRSR